MKKTVFYYCVLAIGFFGTPYFGYGQPILIGCTANVNATSPPSSIVDIDLTTGAATNPRNTGVFLIGGIATQTSTGRLFGLTTFVSTPANSLVQIDPQTGGINVIGNTGLPLVVEGDLAFSPVNGLLYGIQDGGVGVTERNFFRINPNSGAATIIANLSTQGDLSALAFANDGTLFMIDSAAPGNSLLQTIDPNSGVITSTVAMNVNLASTVGMTFDPTTGIGYVADGGDASSTGLLYSLNPGTGVLTPIGPVGATGGISGLAFMAVPEPSSILLGGTGLFTIALRLAFRKKKPTKLS